MPSFHETRTVPRASADMFDLVADFERYPEFAPFCLSAKIRKRSVDSVGIETVIADMEVGYGSIRARFATRDRLDRAKSAIAVDSIDGPFRYFESRWSFRDLPHGGSRIAFSTRYQFSSPAFDILLAPIFSRVVSGLVRAFEKRAREGGVPALAAGRPPPR